MSDENTLPNHDEVASVATDSHTDDPAQMLLPGMELAPEEALLIEPINPHPEVLADEPDIEEIPFEAAPVLVEEVVDAIEAASEPISTETVIEVQPEHDPVVEPESAPEPVVTPAVAEAVEQTDEETSQPERADVSLPAEVPAPAAEALPSAVETEVVETEVVPAETETVPVAEAPIATVEAPTAPVEPAPVSNEEAAASEPAESGFAKLGLDQTVLDAITRQGYTTPTDVQARIIPHMLAGRDVLAQSQTGTGKTAAFALPILSLIDPGQRKPQVLVLAPTRELAMQVAKATEKYGSEIRKLQVAAIYGGSDYGPQLRALKRGVDIVVGTPGRVIDHIKSGKLDLSELRCLVLDEADEMLNMGFLEDVQVVLEHTPSDRQVALFSATMPPAIRGIAQHYLNDPARVTIKTKTMTADSIRQRAIFTVGREKLKVLQRILEAEETDGVIVFVKTKESTIQVAEDLARDGLQAVAINGDMPQKVRERTIQQFRKGRLDILVATDVAARGLDVERVSHVFNFDLPHGSESYVHRIGRTGRAGRKGEAIIFITRSERHKLRNIERVTRQQIEIVDPPTADEINAMRAQRYKDRISNMAETNELSFFRELLQSHAEETGLSMETIAAAVAQMALGRKSFFVKKDKPKKKREFDDRSPRNERNGDRKHRGKDKRDRETTPPEPGMNRYRIAIGWRDGVKPGNIVGAIANEANIDGSAIGHINIQHSFTTIDLPDDLPMEVRQHLYNTRVVGRQMRLGLESEHLSSDSGGRKEGGKRPYKKSGYKGGKGKPTGGYKGGKKKFHKAK